MLVSTRIDVDRDAEGGLLAISGEEHRADDRPARVTDEQLEPIRCLAALGGAGIVRRGRDDGGVAEDLVRGRANQGELPSEPVCGRLRLVRETLVVRDTRLFGDRSDERRDGRDGQQRDRDERQAKPQLDEAQAIAPVEDRVPLVVLALGFRLQYDLGG